MERFWNKVDRRTSNECWPWMASTDQNNYGCFWYQGRLHKASRIAWAITHGTVPKLFVLHKCDNGNCVNPEHLFLGTQKENMADMRLKNRGYIPTPEQRSKGGKTHAAMTRKVA
jgi:hypothetical protein